MATNNAINLSSAGVVSYNGAGAFTGSPITQNAMLYGGASNAITSTAVGTNGQLLIGSTAAAPVLAALTAGTGISVTNGAGSITIAATGGSGLAYTVVTGATQAMVVNHGYIANAAGGGVAFTLPTTSAVGDIIIVDGLIAGSGWTIDYTTGQSIQLGAASSTVTTGSLASTDSGDAVRMVCAVANLTWICESSMGNITVT